MNKISKNTILVVAAIVLLGIAGRCDYNEAVMQEMSESTYKCIKARYSWYSDSEIVDEYQKNKTYWKNTVKEHELLGKD